MGEYRGGNVRAVIERLMLFEERGNGGERFDDEDDRLSRGTAEEPLSICN